MAGLLADNVEQMCGRITDRILKNLTTPVITVGFLPLVSMSVIAVAIRGNPDLMMAGQLAIVAIKKCGHTTNHLPNSPRTLTMKQHATGVQLVTTSGNRIMLMALSYAGIAEATYGHTVKRTCK